MSGQPNLPAERKPQFLAGAPVAALVPQSLEEAFRLSGALAASGMAPKGIDRPEQIMVAIMAGAELGLAPFQSLQSFAVVNGRPTLWGDGLLAVVRGRGVKVKEWIEGEDDKMVAHCVATRPDNGEEIPRAFTVADAKKAGLWGKTGPWTQYPKRMLQMRARALALRDGCADMLRGIQVREEVEDYTHLTPQAPRAAGVRDRLTGPSTGEGFTSATAAAPVEAQVFAEHAEEIAEAEFEAAPAVDEQVDPPAAEEPVAHVEPPAEEPVASLEVADGDFDALDWAASFTRGLAQLSSVPEVEQAWKHAKAAGYVLKLQGKSKPMAEQLVAAVNERVAELKAAG